MLDTILVAARESARTFRVAVALDGEEFSDCEFRSCRLVDSGGPVPKFSNCRFDDIVWKLDVAAQRTLAYLKLMWGVGAKAPVAFFAYPGKPSVMTAEGCRILRLAEPEQDLKGALAWLADELGIASNIAPLAAEPTAHGALPEGPQTIVFRWLGYRPSQVDVTVEAGGTVTADAGLEAVTIALSEIVVQGASRAPERIVEAPAARPSSSPTTVVIG